MSLLSSVISVMTYQMTVNVHTYRVNSIIKLEQILYAIRVLLLLIVKRVKKKSDYQLTRKAHKVNCVLKLFNDLVYIQFEQL